MFDCLMIDWVVLSPSQGSCVSDNSSDLLLLEVSSCSSVVVERSTFRYTLEPKWLRKSPSLAMCPEMASRDEHHPWQCVPEKIRKKCTPSSRHTLVYHGLRSYQKCHVRRTLWKGPDLRQSFHPPLPPLPLILFSNPPAQYYPGASGCSPPLPSETATPFPRKFHKVPDETSLVVAA